MGKLICTLIFLSISFSQNLYNREALSKRNANYEIDVRLEPETKQLFGHQIIKWKNISSIETNELWFHLYI